MPPLIFMSMNFIWIPLTLPLCTKKKIPSPAAHVKRELLKVLSPQIPLWPSSLGCWGGTCPFESKCSAFYWAWFSMHADQDLSFASHRWCKRDNWETLGRGCLLQEAIPSRCRHILSHRTDTLTYCPLFKEDGLHQHSLRCVLTLFLPFLLCYIRTHSAVRCGK